MQMKLTLLPVQGHNLTLQELKDLNHNGEEDFYGKKTPKQNQCS
jgi:hypothetical protein